MAEKQVNDRIDTYTTEYLVSIQETYGELYDLLVQEVDGKPVVHDGLVTSWKREIDRRKKEKKLTNKMIAHACGKKDDDTIKKNWGKRVPMVHHDENSGLEERRNNRNRRIIINLAYGMKLTRKEADELLSKHGGYTRLLDMYDDDMVDIYLFDHRDLNRPVEFNEYNLRHEAHMRKLKEMDAAGDDFVMPPEDQEFLKYCINTRANAVDCKKAVVDFINEYIGSDSEDPLDFCSYMADPDLIRQGRSCLKNWRIMPDKEIVHTMKNGEKVPYEWKHVPNVDLLKEGLRARGIREWENKPFHKWSRNGLRNALMKHFTKTELDEIIDSGKAWLKEKEINDELNGRPDREWLILLGLKLNMPRSLINCMLELSGNNPLYAKNELEIWLINALDSLLLDYPAYFGLYNSSSDRMIEEKEGKFIELKNKGMEGIAQNDDFCFEVYSQRTNLHQRIYDLTSISVPKESRSRAPLWLREKYLTQHLQT